MCTPSAQHSMLAYTTLCFFTAKVFSLLVQHQLGDYKFGGLTVAGSTADHIQCLGFRVDWLPWPACHDVSRHDTVVFASHGRCTPSAQHSMLVYMTLCFFTAKVFSLLMQVGG